MLERLTGVTTSVGATQASPAVPAPTIQLQMAMSTYLGQDAQAEEPRVVDIVLAQQLELLPLQGE